MIDSQEKRKKVKDYLDTMDIDFKNFKDEIWTSGNDLGQEGSYLWMTTGKHLGSAELAFSIFDNKKHINPLGLLLQKIKSENCLAVWNKFGHGLTLNDDDCFAERFFLCEKLDHHHHGPDDCDDDDDHHNYENRNEVLIFDSTSDTGKTSENEENWDIMDHNGESSENAGSWDMNDDKSNDEAQENESPEHEESWNFMENSPNDELPENEESEPESNEDNDADSYFHNTSQNENSSEQKDASWDDLS